jgi:hypothetical protein
MPAASTTPAAAAPAAAKASSPPPDPDAAARADYELTERVGTVQAWDIFLVRHPKGFYADLARQQRAKLATREPAPRENFAPAGAPAAPLPAERPKAAPKAVGRAPAETSKAAAKPTPSATAKSGAATQKAEPQIFCNRGICEPVPAGCRIERHTLITPGLQERVICP